MARRPSTKGHPIFARFYARISPTMDAQGAVEHRRALLAGLAGRVLEVGAGNGLNFPHYPSAVTEVLAVEPDPYLRQLAQAAAGQAPIPVRVVDGTADALPAADATMDATVASLVFGAHAMAALEMTAEQAGIQLADGDREAIAAQMRQLPAHPEVADALRRLRDAGLRLAALTNSTEQVARAQLEHAGLIDAFELVLSADTVGRLKPAPEPYLMAAERLGVAVDQVRLIAAHAWDRAGAARAGCVTAFVARPGKVLDPLVERPGIVGADLAEVADVILAVDGHSDRRS